MIDDPPVTLQRHVPGRRRLVKLLDARQEFCTRKAFFDQRENKYIKRETNEMLVAMTSVYVSDAQAW